MSFQNAQMDSDILPAATSSGGPSTVLLWIVVVVLAVAVAYAVYEVYTLNTTLSTLQATVAANTSSISGITTHLTWDDAAATVSLVADGGDTLSLRSAAAGSATGSDLTWTSNVAGLSSIGMYWQNTGGTYNSGIVIGTPLSYELITFDQTTLG
jgi:hypothetical protein